MYVYNGNNLVFRKEEKRMLIKNINKVLKREMKQLGIIKCRD